ncbi:MAG: hypothetical protein AB1489_30460 [Acidobacteriota bacterium]
MATTIVESSDLKTIAEAFETANTKLKEDPQDTDALFVRAVSSEKLLLLEDAKSDYQKYLAIKSNPSYSTEVSKRLKDVNEQLSTLTVKEHTRYEQVDQYIDDYLAALRTGNNIEAANALASAEQIATKISVKTGDKYGKDLINFYRVISNNGVKPIYEARKILLEIESRIVTDNLSSDVEKLSNIKTLFEQYNANLEVARTNIQIAKCQLKLGELDLAQALLTKSLQEANQRDHLYIQTQLLHRQGQYYAEVSNLNAAIESLKKAAVIAKIIDVPQLLISPTATLSTLFYIANDNQQAFEYGHEALSGARAIDSVSTIQITQVLGGAVFNLSYKSLGEYYLLTSIAAAEKHRVNSNLALSHSLLGIIKAEQGLFDEGDLIFQTASTIVNNIQDEKTNKRLSFIVTGRTARANMLAGRVDKAIALYEQTIELAKQVNAQQILALSQAHQGLAECLIARNDLPRAKKELEIALELDSKAKANSEQQNSLLTLAVTHKSCQEQMRLLQERTN